MIDRQIIDPITEELSNFFDNLIVKKIKKNTRGNPITHYEFTWTPEKTGKWVKNKYDKKFIGSGKTVRKEKLPEWAKEDYIQPQETMLPKEKIDEFNERLARIHEKRKEN